VNPGKREILFEQRNARKDTKNFMEVAFSARMCRACHEIFSCPFVSLVVKNCHPALLTHYRFGFIAARKGRADQKIAAGCNLLDQIGLPATVHGHGYQSGQ